MRSSIKACFSRYGSYALYLMISDHVWHAKKILNGPADESSELIAYVYFRVNLKMSCVGLYFLCASSEGSGVTFVCAGISHCVEVTLAIKTIKNVFSHSGHCAFLQSPSLIADA